MKRFPPDYDTQRDGTAFFGWDDVNLYPCHPLGTYWNGFDNVEVSPAVRALIVEDMRAMADDPDSLQECDDMEGLGVEDNGRISLAYGYATQLESET